jgi:hypothetical protein
MSAGSLFAVPAPVAGSGRYGFGRGARSVSDRVAQLLERGGEPAPRSGRVVSRSQSHRLVVEVAKGSDQARARYATRRSSRLVVRPFLSQALPNFGHMLRKAQWLGPLIPKAAT